MVELGPNSPLTSSLLPSIFDEFSELADLPRSLTSWPLDQSHSAEGTSDGLQRNLRMSSRYGPWQWPDRPVVFVSDPHADAEGFLRSLAASGAIQRHGSAPTAFRLTAFGRAAQIVIGGDCLDKGPSNLDLLDAISALYASEADVTLLAGNHDIRLIVALAALSQERSALTEHLFVRMARKAVPLLAEVCDRFDVFSMEQKIPDEDACRARLLPGQDWSDRFPMAAEPYLCGASIAKEAGKLEQKVNSFEAAVFQSGLTYRQVYAAALYCQHLFFAPDGVYRWFYDRMDVLAQTGSILFVHAGLCDALCSQIAEGGAEQVNAAFFEDAVQNPFGFYFGEIANLVRTKYRPTDRRLTRCGVNQLHQAGIKLVVQGHVNNHAGQRLSVKSGLLHLEGDITLDRASRRLEGLPGIGVGATLIYPSGDIIGLSTDYPVAKLFQPDALLAESA